MTHEVASQPIRLVVVDDDPFICASLQTILDAQEDIEVVAVGQNGAEALQLYQRYQPDILLTDIQMPGTDGLQAAEAILQKWPAARIVVLTTFADDQYIVKALSIGAKGYLIKQDVATIAPALRLVMSGQSVLGSEVLGRMDSLISGRAIDADTPATAIAAGQPGLLSKLTQREFELTKLVAEGLDNREVAAALFVSEGTVRNMISAILQKLALKNRTQLAVQYYREK